MNTVFTRLALLLLVLLLAQACANYRLNYEPEHRDWAGTRPMPAQEPVHKIITVGNLGYTSPEQPIWQKLAEKIRLSGESSTLLVLGSNMPGRGMASKEERVRRAADERHLDAIIELVQPFAGDIYMTSGETDWAEYGLQGLKRQYDYLDERLDRDDLFQPEPGCGTPEEIEINDDLTVLMIDSQWWLEDWTGQPEINAGCDIKSRTYYNKIFEDEVKGNRNKNIVIASHHPPYSNGVYGGQFPLKRHLFPLTFIQESLYVPLPGLGTLATAIRAAVGSKQDISHPQYTELQRLMITAARKNGSFIFAAAHENNLQYIEKDEQAFVITGAGRKSDAVRSGAGADFAYARAGFAELFFYGDGSAWVQYWAQDEKGVQVVYRKEIRGAQAQEVIDSNEVVFEDYPPERPSKRRPISTYDYSRSGLGRILWGDHYRDVYAAEIDIQQLDLATYKGGVIPVKQGGGYQTNSLRLENEHKQQYAMRSVEKDPSRTIPYPFNESFVRDVIKDNFSSAHPLAALVLPTLADAANIYYTNPELYFVPPQPRLGIYNDSYSGALYQLEERPDEKVWTEKKSFGYPKEIYSTSNAVEEILGEHDDIIDYAWTARSRLFDLMIGDWDRHDDQWRFALVDQGEIELFRPIPRDRDQAFSKYDGLVLALARQTVPTVKPFRPYQETIPEIAWTSYGARQFDATFLSGVDWPMWKQQAEYIQEHLTDEVIDRAFSENWPEEVQQLSAEEIKRKLRGRRDRLVETARRFYEFKSKQVDVIGTTEEDLFRIRRLDNGDVRVEVWGMTKAQELKNKYYDRTFEHGVTREIRIYGLDKVDVFQVEGEVSKSILLRIIGGLGDDVVVDRSRVRGLGNKLKIYDTPLEDNNIDKGPSAKVKLSRDPRFNTFNRRSLDYEYDYNIILPIALYNPDDGVSAGAAGQIYTYGFRKEPYATMHQVQARYAFATSGFVLDYYGEFIDLFGTWELKVDARLQSDLYTTNFYGFGNDTPNPEEELGRDYNRVRQRLIDLSPGFMKKINANTSFSIGPVFQAVEVDQTGGRFIDDVAASLNPAIFDGVEYLGAEARFDFNYVDNVAFPTRGIRFNTRLAYLGALKDDDRSVPLVEGSFSFYKNLDPNRKLIVATRVGGKYLFTDEFEFFQGATLGGIGPNSNFRGFRRDRFTGSAAFYQNIDLRWKFLESTNQTVPFSMGVLLGGDHGRVWIDGEDSDTWHYSYGGGLFISPFNLASVNLSFFRGDDEQTRFVAGASFFF